MKLLLAMALALGLITTATQGAEAPDADAAAVVLADRIERDQQGVGLAAALLGPDGKPSFVSQGALAAEGPAVDEHTMFEIGSLTKLFTNLLLAQLVLEGQLDLDKPVADYLPETITVPEFDGQAITLFDLATHSSGLPSIPPELAFADPADPYAHYNAAMLGNFLAAYSLPRAPGSQYEYSNIGVSLLGLAISHVTEQPYAELVQSRILDPLQMTDTRLMPEDAARLASGHDKSGEPVPHWTFDVFAPAGAYLSTADDLATFLAVASGQVETPLKPAFDLMIKRTRPAGSPNMTIGLGWMILSRPDGKIIWHNGITGGFNSFAGFAEDGSAAAIVLANQVSATGIEDIGFHLIDAALPLTAQVPPRVSVEIDPAVLPNYVGEYQLGPEFDLTITTEDGKLYAEATGQGQFELFAESATEFFYRVVDAQISFETGVDGQATGLVLHQNGQDLAGKRR